MKRYLKSSDILGQKLQNNAKLQEKPSAQRFAEKDTSTTRIAAYGRQLWEKIRFWSRRRIFNERH